MGTINTSMHAVQQAQDDLSELDSLPPLGQDMVNIARGFIQCLCPGRTQGCALWTQPGEVKTMPFPR